ncbi:MAG: hypothetical protein U0324_04825 [Polyangiales bacterium]
MTRAALAVVVLAACADATPPAPPAPLPECPTTSAPTVALGFGAEGTTPLARDAVAAQVFGPQGLSHVFVGARTAGLGAALDLRFEARDAFTGGLLGAARLPAATATRFADSPDGTCDVRRVLLAFNGLFPGGAGLATIRVTAAAPDGRSATDAQRVWIGRALPACVPGDGVAPSLTPLTLQHPTLRREEAAALRDDDTLTPVSAGDALLGVASLGFAASAVTLTVTVAEDTPAGRQTLREYRAAPVTGDVTVGALPRRLGPGCVSPATVRVPVEAALTGRPLVLVFRADDGLGHSLTQERTVSFTAG